MPSRKRKLSVEAIVSLAARQKGQAFVAEFQRKVQAEIASVVELERQTATAVVWSRKDICEKASVRSAAVALGLDPEEIAGWLLGEGEALRRAATTEQFGMRAHEALGKELLRSVEQEREELHAWLEQMVRQRAEWRERNWWKFWKEDEWPARGRKEWQAYKRKRERENAETRRRLAKFIRGLSAQEHREWLDRLGELDSGLESEPTDAFPVQQVTDAYAERGQQILQRYSLKDYLCPALRSASNDAFEIAKVVTPVAIGLQVAGTLPVLAPAAVAAIAIALAKVGIAVYCADRRP